MTLEEAQKVAIVCGHVCINDSWYTSHILADLAEQFPEFEWDDCGESITVKERT